MKNETVTLTRAEYEELQARAFYMESYKQELAMREEEHQREEHSWFLIRAEIEEDAWKAEERVKELEQERDALKARIAALEAERDTLNRGVQYWQNVANTNDKKAALCWEVEQRCKNQEEAIKELVKGWDEWKEENTELKARIERVRLYGKNIAYTAKYRRNDWAMGEESATNFILSILDGSHKD